MTERQVQKELKKHFLKRSATLCIDNVYWFDPFESDTLVVTKEDMVIECEIKASKFDYLNDFRKQDKHDRLEQAYDYSIIPNQFYFVCPEGLIHVGDIPHYAGLLYIVDKGMGKRYVKEVVRAPMLHKEPIALSRWRDLAVKMFTRIS